MFPRRFFPARMFAPRYFPGVAVTSAPTPVRALRLFGAFVFPALGARSDVYPALGAFASTTPALGAAARVGRPGDE